MNAIHLWCIAVTLFSAIVIPITVLLNRDTQELKKKL